MVDKCWVCKRCLHATTTKSNLLSHLRNKKCCQVSAEGGEAIPVQEYIDSLLPPRNQPKKYSCQHCDAMFNTRQSKHRHMKSCTIGDTTDDNPVSIDIVKQLEERLAMVEARLQSTPLQQFNTQININVSLNNFGHEDVSYLSSDFLSYCLLNPRKGMTQLIENIHYNVEYPENHNLRCKSLKQNVFERYVDSEWKACDASNTLDELIKKGYRILNEHYTENVMNNPNMLEDEHTQRIYERFRFLGDTNCTDYYAIKRELRLLVKDKTMYLLASPDTLIPHVSELSTSNSISC